MEAIETELSIDEVSEDEIFPVEELMEFRIKLINGDSDVWKVVPLMVWDVKGTWMQVIGNRLGLLRVE